MNGVFQCTLCVDINRCSGHTEGEGRKGCVQMEESERWEENEGSGAPECPACGGEGVSLGMLGQLEHYRCRACGMNYSQKAAWWEEKK